MLPFGLSTKSVWNWLQCTLTRGSLRWPTSMRRRLRSRTGAQRAARDSVTVPSPVQRAHTDLSAYAFRRLKLFNMINQLPTVWEELYATTYGNKSGGAAKPKKVCFIWRNCPPLLPQRHVHAPPLTRALSRPGGGGAQRRQAGALRAGGPHCTQLAHVPRLAASHARLLAVLRQAQPRADTVAQGQPELAAGRNHRALLARRRAVVPRRDPVTQRARSQCKGATAAAQPACMCSPASAGLQVLYSTGDVEMLALDEVINDGHLNVVRI